MAEISSLSLIARPDSVINYLHDRFGRLLQDGALGFTWDANGNAATIVYLGDVTAIYTYDFADRPESLPARRPDRPDQPLHGSGRVRWHLDDRHLDDRPTASHRPSV